jgi:hypothetical protein
LLTLGKTEQVISAQIVPGVGKQNILSAKVVFDFPAKPRRFDKSSRRLKFLVESVENGNSHQVVFCFSQAKEVIAGALGQVRLDVV